jgi:hypothetical protein
MKSLLTILLMTIGCSGTIGKAPVVATTTTTTQVSPTVTQTTVIVDNSRKRCQSLTDRESAWGMVITSAAFATGASGIGSIATEDKNWRMGLAIGTVTISAIGAGAMYLMKSNTAAKDEECGK